MNTQKIIEGAQNMVQKRITNIAQAAAGTNLRRRVNVTQNYLTNLRKLQTYLYGGRSNVRNVPGFERARLNANIRTAENGLVLALHEYLNELSKNAIQASVNLYETHMENEPTNNTGTLTNQQRQVQYKLRGYRIALKHLQNEIQREPMLARVGRVQRSIRIIQTFIRQFEQKNRNFNKGRKILGKRTRNY